MFSLGVLTKNLIQILYLIFLKISGMAAAIMDGPPVPYLPGYRMNFSKIHHLKNWRPPM